MTNLINNATNTVVIMHDPSEQRNHVLYKNKKCLLHNR